MDCVRGLLEPRGRARAFEICCTHRFSAGFYISLYNPHRFLRHASYLGDQLLHDE